MHGWLDGQIIPTSSIMGHLQNYLELPLNLFLTNLVSSNLYKNVIYILFLLCSETQIESFSINWPINPLSLLSVFHPGPDQFARQYIYITAFFITSDFK